MNPAVLDLSARVVFFPVRHHSPACARAVRDFIRRLKPAVVLIEGPTDFNDRIGELYLGHELPIAIYSWAGHSTPDGSNVRRGAFYPFCEYSPEWQALQTTREIGAKAEFIDLPWAGVIDAATPTHRYAEPELRGSPYVGLLCEKLGAPDLDALWDRLFEIEPLPPEVIWERCHHFCYSIRASDRATPPEDFRREAFMVSQIERILQEIEGRILVVTGGFHSYALFARLHRIDFDHDNETEDEAVTITPESQVADDISETSSQRGLALTPYSYERLDSLKGYEAGMQSPGFYDRVWQVREKRELGSIHQEVLAQTTKKLRKHKQTASSADLIAVLSTARALANLRGHSEVWRRDLVDGIVGALVKDELEGGGNHPFLDAVYEALRGDARGRIAADAPRAPLLSDVEKLLRVYELEVEAGHREVELDLFQAKDLERSRILHRLRVLGIAGYSKIGGSDFLQRSDLMHPKEVWRLQWTPEATANVTEASIYGVTLESAGRSKLLEGAKAIERNAAASSVLMVDAALMGSADLAGELLAQIVSIVRQEGDFFRLAGALNHLLYLFHFDATLGTTSLNGLGVALREAWERGIWLLETLGSPQGRDKDITDGISALMHVWQRCASALELEGTALLATFGRIAGSSSHGALLRGAVTGALWTLQSKGIDQVVSPDEPSNNEVTEEAGPETTVLEALPLFAEPAQLGDFLTGLFALAREVAQRKPELVKEIDRLLAAYDNDRFLEALPSLRLAFSYFTPREKHHIALTLMEGQAKPLPDLEVDAEMAMRALEIENRIFDTLQKFGLRPFIRRSDV